MQYQITSKNCVGETHLKCNQHSQDAIYGIQSGQYCCIALADGASSKCNSGEGALLAVHYTCSYLMKHKKELFNALNIPRLRYKFTKGLYRHLRRYAQKRAYPLFTFGSTLLFVITDGRNYISGHIGDGAILCERKKGYNVISFPDGFDNKTYLTTSFFSYKHFRIHYGECDQIQSFMLISDGIISSMFYDYYQIRYPGTLLVAAKKSVLMPHDDDASFISCEWSR